MGVLLDEGLSGFFCCLEDLCRYFSRLVHPNLHLRVSLLVSMAVPSAFPSPLHYLKVLFNHCLEQIVNFPHIFIIGFNSFLTHRTADGRGVVPQGLPLLIATLRAIGIIRQAFRPFLEARLNGKFLIGFSAPLECLELL